MSTTYIPVLRSKMVWLCHCTYVHTVYKCTYQHSSTSLLPQWNKYSLLYQENWNNSKWHYLKSFSHTGTRLNIECTCSYCIKHYSYTCTLDVIYNQLKLGIKFYCICYSSLHLNCITITTCSLNSTDDREIQTSYSHKNDHFHVT